MEWILILFLLTYAQSYTIPIDDQESLDFEDGTMKTEEFDLIYPDDSINNLKSGKIEIPVNPMVKITKRDTKHQYVSKHQYEQSIQQENNRNTKYKDENGTIKQQNDTKNGIIKQNANQNEIIKQQDNRNHLKWYHCSSGLIVQLTRTGTTNNKTTGYDSIYNYFVNNLNNTDNPYNVKNNTYVNGFYGRYKVVRAYRPKNSSYNEYKIVAKNVSNNNSKNTNDFNKIDINTNDLVTNCSTIEKDSNLVTKDILKSGNFATITKEEVIAKKKVNNSCNVMNSNNCPSGFIKLGGYCSPDLKVYDESDFDYADYEFELEAE